MQDTLLTFKVVARPNFLFGSSAVFSSELRRRIGAVSNKLLCATTTASGAFWDWLPWSEATVNSFMNESIQMLRQRVYMQCRKLRSIEMVLGRYHRYAVNSSAASV